MAEFVKPALTIEEQVQLLFDRGLVGDPNRIARKLEVVWQRYCFDRKLRLLVLDAIERVEVAVRSRVAYVHAHAFEPFAYIRDSDASLPTFATKEREEFLAPVNLGGQSLRDVTGRLCA